MSDDYDYDAEQQYWNMLEDESRADLEQLTGLECRIEAAYEKKRMDDLGITQEDIAETNYEPAY